MKYDVGTGSADPPTRKGFKRNNRCLIIYGIVAIVIGFIVGILIGRYVTCPEEDTPIPAEGVFLEGVSEKIIKDGDPNVSQMLIDGVNADNIRNYLR